MSNDFDWGELAQTQAKDVKPPALIPDGHYIAMHAGPMKKAVAKSGNNAMDFPFKLVGPGDDVDQTALAEVGGLPEGRTYSLKFWMSADARWRFTAFTAAQGISDELNLIEQASALIEENKPFLIEARTEEIMQANGTPHDPQRYRTVFDNPAPVA